MTDCSTVLTWASNLMRKLLRQLQAAFKVLWSWARVKFARIVCPCINAWISSRASLVLVTLLVYCCRRSKSSASLQSCVTSCFLVRLEGISNDYPPHGPCRCFIHSWARKQRRMPWRDVLWHLPTPFVWVFWLGPAPFLVFFVVGFAAKRKSGWGICGSLVFLFSVLFCVYGFAIHGPFGPFSLWFSPLTQL